MRELDFDAFKNQDAGRAAYRAVIIYCALEAFRRLGDGSKGGIVPFIQGTLWKPANCFV